MDSKANPEFDFTSAINHFFKKALLNKKEKDILDSFFRSYLSTCKSLHPTKDFSHILELYLDVVTLLKNNPFIFSHYHEKIRHPFDYYQFGLEFLRPLVDAEHSTVSGSEQIQKLNEQIKQGHNAILFANHQIEADPQAISLLLENICPKLAEEIIFVAGERVITDPLAVPLSMGRNLLCIYSKKYIDNPPEDKQKKQLHNKKTMEVMSQLLSEGGKCIYVAPSGGRDRPDSEGNVHVAEFDPQSIEMFYLMAKKAGSPTHFYPLALKTYMLLPPPATIQIELGEERKTEGGAIHLSLGSEIDMASFESAPYTDKHHKRKMRAGFIWNAVCSEYVKFP